MRTSATIQQLETALKQVNEMYDGNIKFRDIKQISKNRVQFTLTVVSSKGPGHRISASYFQHGRLVHAACWHVHGHFFDLLWELDRSIVIWSGVSGKMEGPKDNWQDRNIGSIMYPIYHSEACECE